MFTLRRAESNETFVISFREMPCSIGRASSCTFRLAEQGVFDQHAILDLNGRSARITAAQEAFVYVNGQAEPSRELRTGDVITIGSARLIFELSSPPRRSFAISEIAISSLIVLITAFQIVLALTH